LGAAGALSLFTFAPLFALALAGCKGEHHRPPEVDAGQEDGVAACPSEILGPLFTVTITAEGGVLPPDMSVIVDWSAGTEPPFVLSEPSTWLTPEDGANVVCDIGEGESPEALGALRCELWTSGPTEVFVAAKDFREHKETLTPGKDDDCEGPMPTAVEIDLRREDKDAGAPP
jgi:hypothetical protein